VIICISKEFMQFLRISIVYVGWKGQRERSLVLEPAFNAIDYQVSHGFWSVISGEVLSECCYAQLPYFLSFSTGAAKYMVQVLVKASTCRASAINGIVVMAALLECRSPTMDVLGYLQLPSGTQGLECLSMYSPINITKDVVIPFIFDVRIMLI
jgi:hypothetical protein